MKYYVVASNTAFTVICKAKNKSHAMQIARDEFWQANGVRPEEYNNFFEVYEASKYLEADPLVIYD